MQVTQCDRCGELPIEPMGDGSEHTQEEKYRVVFGVVCTKVTGTGSTTSHPDLCPDCFWKLVRQAIKEAK